MKTDDRTPSILICIPTYNERENIERIVPAVLEYVPYANVLIIDDSSPDGTGQLADVLAQNDPRVYVLHRPEKEGLGKAYIDGFSWGLEKGYLVLIEFDADFSHRPEHLPQMLARLENADMVVGSRRVKGGEIRHWTWTRKLLSALGSMYAGAVLDVPILDLTGGFNGFKASTLHRIDYSTISASTFMFQIEIKYRCHKEGLIVDEMPITFTDRVYGKSKMSSKIIKDALWSVIKLRLRDILG